MKLHIPFFYVALLSIGIMPQAVAQPLVPISKIPRVSEIQPPLTSAEWLTQQPPPTSADDSQVVQVTGVRLNPTPTGFEVILDTADAVSPQVLTKSEGNNLIADIPNAVLALPEGQEFRALNPVESITSVTVTQLDANTIRVSVTGETAVPTARVVPSASGLVLSLTPAAQEEGEATEAPEGEEEIEIVVTAEQEEVGYQVEDANTGTRTDTPIRDIPQAIQVIPEQVIEDRQVVRLNELAENVSGVQPQSGYCGLSSQGYFFRGFSGDFSTLRNGFRDFGFLSPRDVANVERVEFLRGPASVLYGNTSSLGGVVNTITKKPLAEPRYEINSTIGSYEFYRPTIDFTGPIADNFLYRLNVAYENAESFRDFNENESIFVAPALTWQIGPRTNLTTEFEYQNYDYVCDRGLPPVEEAFDVPVNRFLGEPDFSGGEYDSFSFTYNFVHEFSDQWRFRQGFNVLTVDGGIREISPSNFDTFLEDDRRTLARRALTTDESQENYALQNDIIGEFQTGSLRHNLLVGVELARYEFAYDFFEAPIAPINIFDPEYGAEPGIFEPSFGEEYGSRNFAVYFQDLVNISPKWIFLAGGRVDWNDSSYLDRFTDEELNEQSETEFSPRVGIVYQPSDSTSLYFSWANSFNPQIFSRSRTDEVFEPEKGEQFEFGVKQSFLDDRLSATLALYHLTRKNVLTTDPEDPNFSIQTGEQTSRGVELDMIGEILPGWNIIATYAYTDAFVSEDNELPVDDRLIGVPEHSASLWTTYEIQGGDLQGLGFGLGLVFVGEREAQLPNTDVTLPSFFRTDARISYRRNNYQAAINIKNLFDIDYYNTSSFFIVPAPPLTVLGTVSVEF